MRGMVTRIHKANKGRLFLKEHRVAKKVSAKDMAGRLGIERESVYRIEREPQRVDSGRQIQWADALGISPARLWSPPGAISLDEIAAPATDDVRAMAADIVQRLVAGKR